MNVVRPQASIPCHLAAESELYFDVMHDEFEGVIIVAPKLVLSVCMCVCFCMCMFVCLPLFSAMARPRKL